MEFRFLSLVTAAILVMTEGVDKSVRHLIHDATASPLTGGEGVCDHGYARHHDMIESPNFPNKYNVSTDCYYHIYAGKGNVIHIRFWLMSVEEHTHCNYDYLEIRNAQDELVGKYCGFELPGPLNVSETAHLRFHSDFSRTFYGFQLEYYVSHSDCIFGDEDSGCALPCKCETAADQLVRCDPQTGQCVMGECRRREAVDDMLSEVWSGPACQIGNVAYQRPTRQIGTYQNMDSSKAVDLWKGKSDPQKHCAHPDSKQADVPAWWTVDLGSLHRIYNLTIYNTWDIGGAKRLSDFTVLHGNSPNISSQQVCAVYKDTVDWGDHVSLTCDAIAQYISIVRVGGVQVHMMTLCEVVVMGHVYHNVDCSRCTGVCEPEIYCDQCDTGYKTPTCRDSDHTIVCGEPPAPPQHGYKLISGTSFGDVVTYKCDAGFYAVGGTVIECDINGDWSGEVPTCDRISCGSAPAAPAFGRVEVTGTVYEDTVLFECDPDMKLQGPEQIVCEASGLWSEDPPICVQTDVTCGVPPAIEHGEISPVNGSAITSVAEYLCSGFLVKGSGYVVCSQDARWIPLGEESECSDCGGALEAKNVTTMISHPLSREKYRNSQNCTWVIYAEKPGHGVELTWFHMDIEPNADCIHDSLTVYDSNGHALKWIGKFCGDELLSDIRSLGDMLVLNFQSDASVEMTGFKAEFKAVQASVDLDLLLASFYPELGSVLGIEEAHGSLSNGFMYLLDTEIGAQNEIPTYVYLVQSIDAFRYLVEKVFLPRLQKYFIGAFEHTLSHSVEAKLGDITVAYKLFEEVSEPIRKLVEYLTVYFGDDVPANKRLSCFDEIYSLCEHAISEGQTNGHALALEVLEKQKVCIETIGKTNKRFFLDQMQSGPFEIYTGSMSAQSMYMLVKAYVDTSITDAVAKLESKLASIPVVVSSVFFIDNEAAIYLEELRLQLHVLTDTIQFLNDVRDDYVNHADQRLSNLDVGWELPQQDQYGRPILHRLLDELLKAVEKHSVQAVLSASFIDVVPLGTPVSEAKERQMKTIADQLVFMLDRMFRADCVTHKIAALTIGLAEVKMLDVAESEICRAETANSVGSEIDCNLVNAKALAFFREHIRSLGIAMDNLLGGSIASETFPLAVVFMESVSDIRTLGDLVHYLVEVAVPKFETAVVCDEGDVNVPEIVMAFDEFSKRLQSLNSLAEEIAQEMSDSVLVDNGVQQQVNEILKKQFTSIREQLQPFENVNTYPELLEAITQTMAAFLSDVYLELEGEGGPINTSVDFTPILELLQRQDLALNTYIEQARELKIAMITALSEQGVDVCQAAPQLCEV